MKIDFEDLERIRLQLRAAKAILEENGYKVMDTRNQRFLNPIYRKYRDILTPLTNHTRESLRMLAYVEPKYRERVRLQVWQLLEQRVRQCK